MSTATIDTLPENDEGVKIADTLDRARQLLTAASNRPADQRAQLDRRAFHQMARHLVNPIGDEGVEFYLETLPAYGEKGKGSLRYTKQRAALLVNIAAANACVAELAYTGYAYPNPKTKRRNYFVNVWGAPSDIARVKVLFNALQARVIRDGYAIAMDPGLTPPEQTKIRREFFATFAEVVGDHLEHIMTTMVEERNATRRVQERRLAAEAVQTQHHLDVGDRETTESTAS